MQKQTELPLLCNKRVLNNIKKLKKASICANATSNVIQSVKKFSGKFSSAGDDLQSLNF